MKVHFAHLCEKAFLAQNGNLNLIGIFERIASQGFPVVFPQLSLVTSLEGEEGEHQMSLTVVNRKTQQDLLKPIILNLKIEKKQEQQKPENLRLIGDINNLKIDQPGEYEARITLDGELSYRIPFQVVLVQKPIPKGR